MNLMKTLTLALGLAVALVAPAAAQCGIDDGFAGPCCTPTTPNLPVFPALQTTGRAGVIRDCGVEMQFGTGTTVQPFNIVGDYYAFNIMINGGGVNIPASTFLGKYSRTWMESSSVGMIQVWRFLVNADVTYTLNAALIPGLPVPMSAFPPFNLPVHFNGAVDYALNCGSNTWNVAYWLTHGCPTEMHAPWSGVPIPAAAGWPSRTYHYVAPGNINFNAVGPAPVGFIAGEAIRTSGFNTAGNYTTYTETPIFNGNLANGPLYCGCLPTGGTALGLRNSDQTMQGVAGCMGMVTPFSTFPVPGILPTGMRGLSIGAHILPQPAGTFYPALGTRVTHEMAVINYSPVCPQLLPSPVHLYGGIGTQGPNPVWSFTSLAVGGVISNQVDLGNMLVLAGGGWTIGFGQLYVSDLVFNLSVL